MREIRAIDAIELELRIEDYIKQISSFQHHHGTSDLIEILQIVRCAPSLGPVTKKTQSYAFRDGLGQLKRETFSESYVIDITHIIEQDCQ